MPLENIKIMDNRRSGRGRGQGVRQSQAQWDDQGLTTGPNQGQENEGDKQVATAINGMIDILARLAERQGPEPINQLKNQETCENRAILDMHPI